MEYRMAFQLCALIMPCITVGGDGDFQVLEYKKHDGTPLDGLGYSHPESCFHTFTLQ
jgi:hypothetical protein